MSNAEAHQVPKSRRGVNIAVPQEMHRRLKVAAAYRGLTLQQIVEKAINAGLNGNPGSLNDSQQIGKNGTNVPVENEG